MSLLRNNWVRIMVLFSLGIVIWETMKLGYISILFNIAPITLGYLYLSKSIENEIKLSSKTQKEKGK